MVDGGRKNMNKYNPKIGRFNDENTQPVDTQISTESFPGDDHEGYHDKHMGPADNQLFFNDAFETELANISGENQILDIGGETQVVDFCGETQVVDFGGETQLVDFGSETQRVDLGGETQLVDDLDGPLNKPIEVVLDSDSEGSDRTEVLCDTQEVSDDDSINHSFSTLDQVKLPKIRSNPSTGDGSSFAQSDVLSNDERYSGSLRCGFTSIRAASLRASGLAARDMRYKETKRSTWSINSDNPLEQDTAVQNWSSVVGCQYEVRKELKATASEEFDEQIKEVGNENRCKGGSSAARKLFGDEMLVELKASEDGNTGAQKEEDAYNELAGLSYLDSQEPGEDTQANALEVVDKFLNLNPFDFDQHIDSGKSSVGKSKTLSAVKGTKALARTSAARITAVEGGIFDWDDNLEDEGGGEFFQKKKDLLTGKRAATEPRKRGSLNPLRQGVEDCREKEKHPLSSKKVKGPPRSVSRLMSRKGKVKKEPSKSKSRENFAKELDDQHNEGADDVKVDDGNGDDVPNMMLDVGLDTQMAAEAMQTLCFQVHGLENDHGKEKKGGKTLREGSYKSRVDDQSLSNRRSSKNKVQSSYTRPVTRLCPGSAEKDATLVEEHLRVKVKQPKRIKKEDDKGPGGGLKMVKPNVVNPHASRVRKGELRQDERTPEASTSSFTPVARRTRQRQAESRPKSCLFDAGACETLMDEDMFGPDGNSKLQDMKSAFGNLCAVDYPKGRRSHRKMPSMGKETTTLSCKRSKRLRGDHASTSIDVTAKRKKFSLEYTPSKDYQEKLLQKGQGKEHQGGTSTYDAFVDDAHRTESSTGEQCDTSANTCTTPTNLRIVKNSVSPICMGDEYHKQSCMKNMSRLSLFREVFSLHSTTMQVASPLKDSRKRREMTNVRVLFSQHLDADVIKQQKRILSRLGASFVSSMSDGTHFVADEFVRTRNMLEAIAVGKPVVTHLWLESCGQASCLIDEKNYILRDARKEKEFGFSMPVSLARACQHPLLQGYRVFITPNTKPGKEILATLAKAVHGLAFERLCRTVMKDEVIPDDLLVLSCEEDYEVCIPFLEKGATVYSSELLLNGIVTQRLEFDRYRLFLDHVKRTRSTVWVKKNNKQFQAVAKCK